MPAIARYAIVTLTPLAFLALGATGRGEFAVAALVWLTLVAALFDGLFAVPDHSDRGRFAIAPALPVVLGAGHLALLPLVLVALAGPDLEGWQKLALFFATASFIGQVSHQTAHELIHRDRRLLRWLGGAVYTSMGFGHHVSAHRLVHHRHVGTPADPNTPLPGEGFWRYLRRAWAESFRAGLVAEEARLARRGRGPRNLRNPYWIWIAGETVALILAAVIAGPAGLLAYLGLLLLAGGQILLSDYVQHYGLTRLHLPSGRLEPVGPHHSWNAPRAFSSYLMMNAPSHSEHHLHPDRSYDRLGTGDDGPALPRSMPVMAMLALLPPIWRRLMDRRAASVMAAAEARIASSAAAMSGEEAAAGAAENAPEQKVSNCREPTYSRRDLSPLPALPEEDGALLSRVQGQVEGTSAIEAARPESNKLKLPRAVRSARRAALRDR